MEIEKHEQASIERAIDTWEREGKLTHEQSDLLRQSIYIKKLENGQIAKYFFFIAISCAILSFGALFIDEKLLEKIKQYFSLNNTVIAVLTGFITIAWYWYVNRVKNKISHTTYEAYMALGALSVLTTVVYICKIIGEGQAYTTFLIIACSLLFILSIWFKSGVLWLGGILALMGWFGAFSTWQSTNNLFLGMNYPVRFAVFGIVILLLSLLQLRTKKLLFTQQITYATALIIFFTGMWGVSVFGNISTIDKWLQIRQVHVLAYSIVFGIAAIICFYLGIKYKDAFARDIGILFLLLNFYTRYFEYFWNTMNKGIFFLVLAITFGLLGRWLERKKRKRKTTSANLS